MLHVHQQSCSRRKLLLRLLCCALCLTSCLITVLTTLAIRGLAFAEGADIVVLRSVLLQQARSQGRLQPGKPVEGFLPGGETHAYQIDLSEGQFLYVIVEQRGIDVLVTLQGPDGKRLVEVNAPDSLRIPESIWHVSELAGTYEVLVRSLEKGAGNYQVKIEEQRAATAQDRHRAEGQRTLLRGAQLLGQQTEGSAKQAAEKFQLALDLWQQSGDREGEADSIASIGLFYSLAEDREKALEYLNRALELVRALACGHGKNGERGIDD